MNTRCCAPDSAIKCRNCGPKFKGKPMDPDTLWKLSAQTAAAADDGAFKALKKAMKPGRTVEWDHGPHRRRGEVIEVIGFSHHGAQVRVKSSISGKVVDVLAWSIMQRL